MDKPTIIISMPKRSTKQDILDMRNQYKDLYKVHIVISGQEDPKENIKNFLLNRLEI